MKTTKRLLILAAGIISVFLLCSCARDTMDRMGYDTRNAMRNGRNILDNGINSVENGLERGIGTITGGTMYSADSGYSGNASIGTGTVSGERLPYDGNATEIKPTLRSKARRDLGTRRSNAGQINTNNGSADKGIDGNGNR